MECIDSALNQTCEDFELIIVNDNSPYDVEGIIKNYNDSRIKYYKNSVGFGVEKVVGNWNRCLEYAHGDYIICMGDDDKLLPNFLEDLSTLINKYPDLDIYYSRTQLINEKSIIFETLPIRPEQESVYEMILRRWNGGSMFIGDYCYRVSSLRARGGFYDLPFAWGSDAISAYEAAKQKGIANTHRPGFQYRVNQHSISSNSNNINGKIFAIKQERKWFEDFFRQDAPNSKDQKILLQLRSMMHSHFVHMVSADIIHGVMCHPMQQIKYWTPQRKEIGLSRWELIKCFIHGVIGK